MMLKGPDARASLAGSMQNEWIIVYYLFLFGSARQICPDLLVGLGRLGDVNKAITFT